MVAKKERREAVKKILSGVDEKIRRQASEELKNSFQSVLNADNAENIACFVSLPDEIDTFPLLEAILEAKQSVALPRIEDGRLILCEVTDLGQLIPGSFGVMEPDPEVTSRIEAAEVNVWIVPGVAFDAAGRRLGRGKGYYDRALCGASAAAVKIGIGYDFQLVDEVPSEAHDVAMDKVITSRTGLTG